MDTGETYINMCEEAKKYLPEYTYKNGNWYSTVFHDGVFLVHTLNDAWADIPQYREHPSECFPAYSQDQLQEMVGGLEKGFIDFPKWLENVYGLNYGNYPNGHLNIFKSWEQLWLAFVMSERFGKIWSGTEWVKEE